MHPQVRDPQPGLCPVCAMDLVEATRQKKRPGVTFTAEARTQAGLRTSPVTLARLPPFRLRLFGQLRVQEARRYNVNSWVAGRVEQILVDTAGTKVEARQPLLVFHSPELFAAQQRLVDAQLDPVSFAPGGHGYDHLRAARDSLRRMGMEATAIARIETSLRASPRLTIRAPKAGTLVECAVEPGDQVAAGRPLLRIANLEQLEVELEVHTSQYTGLRPGQPVELTVSGFPGRHWRAKLSSLDADFDARTRRTYVRAIVHNPDGTLRPGMPVTAVLDLDTQTHGNQVPVIPASSVLFTGKRSVVYVEHSTPNGWHYVAHNVLVGPRRGQLHQVFSGLSLGDRVVRDGAFVVDAETQLQGDAHMLDLARSSERPTSVFQLEPVGARGVQPLFETYLAIGRHLANDDGPAARALAIPKDPPPAPVGPPELATAWSSLFTTAESAKAEMSKATALPELRRAYQRLTQALLLFLTRVTNPLSRSLYLVHCPMVPGGGAHWLQADTEINNVYFGAQMLRCGQIELQLASNQSLPTDVVATKQAGR